MIRSLRRGSVSVELNHKFGTDLVRGEETEIELSENEAIFRTTLKPVDENERSDADRYVNDESYGLESITIVDSQVREKLEKFLNAYADKIQKLLVEIKYTKNNQYEAKLVPINNDGILFNLIMA